MWHKKIVESINWEHYLNDVLKLEGEQLQYVLTAIKSVPASVYENYLKVKLATTGNLAKSLRSTGVISSEYIYCPLTLSIDEVEWAIVHNYVHPRDVVVVSHKSGISLISKLSNDILLTLLADENLERNPKLLHYLETERALRNKTTDESFEDFTVTPFKNPEFEDIKPIASMESKIARALISLRNSPAQEESEQPEVGRSNDFTDTYRRSNAGTRIGFINTSHTENIFINREEALQQSGSVIQLQGPAINIGSARNGIQSVWIRDAFTSTARKNYRIWFKVGRDYRYIPITDSLYNRLLGDRTNYKPVFNNHGFIITGSPNIARDTGVSFNSTVDATANLADLINELYGYDSQGGDSLDSSEDLD